MKSSSKNSTKRLLFDRRYGWIYDDWREPSEEAFADGRGLFCIFPLGKSALNMVSESINLIGSSTVKIIQKPELLSPQALQGYIDDQLKKAISSVRKPEFKLFALNSQSDVETKEAQSS